MYTFFYKLVIISYGDEMKKYKNELFGILIFIFYLGYSKYMPYVLTYSNFDSLPIALKLFSLILVDLLLLIIISFAYLSTIAKDFKDFKLNFKKYINEYTKYWFLNIGLMAAANIIISSLIDIKQATNQVYVESLLFKYPIYSIITAAIIAPITEELIFRLNFRKIFKTDILFIFISGLVFGIMHMSIAESVPELLYIIPYSIPGFIFAYTLKKSNNIFVPISLHVFHNTIMILMQFLIR